MSENPVHGFGIFNRKPLVIHLFRYLDDVYPVIQEFMTALGDNANVTFLVSLGWSLVAQFSSPDFQKMLFLYRTFRARYTNLCVIYLANDDTECFLLRQLGIESARFQHNAFLRPDNYKPISGIGLKYDSIYVARIHPYKRLELMEMLHNSVLISASVDRDYFSRIKDRIKDVRILNESIDGINFLPLSRQATLDAIQASSVGLCLSEVEGAMFASAEYLLRGIPVVSTCSIGGRDAFATDDHWLFCEASPEGVARAVDEMQKRQISPEEIIARTKGCIMKMRLELVEFLWRRFSATRAVPDELCSRLVDIHSEYLWEKTSVSTLLARLG